MKPVKLDFKNNEFRLVVVGTNKIVSRDKSKEKCLAFLLNQREYALTSPFVKGQHYAV